MEKKQYRPEVSAWKIVLTYDDRGRYSPDEFSIDNEVIEKLADLIPPIKEYLLTPPLSTGGFRLVDMPVRCEGEKEERLIKPVWKLAAPINGRAYGFGTYYDSIERKIFEITEPKPKAEGCSRVPGVLTPEWSANPEPVTASRNQALER